MKRAAAVLLSIVVLLSACSLPQKAPPFSPVRDYVCGFTLTKGDFVCGGTVTCLSYDDVRLTFAYPEGLSCFNVRAGESGGVTETAGDTDTLFWEELPEDSALKLFLNALRRFTFTNVPFTRTAEGAYACGDAFADLTVRGLFSPTGDILKLECPENGLLIEFEKGTGENE